MRRWSQPPSCGTYSKRMRELERPSGKKTLENEMLKEAFEIARSKKLLSRRPLPSGEDTL